MANVDHLGNCKHEFVWRKGRLTEIQYQVCKHCTYVQKWGR